MAVTGNAVRGALLGSVLVCAASVVCAAQDFNQPSQVEGYSGMVSVIPNAERGETTVALTLSYERTGHSNQIVFHLQETSGAVPATWTGQARVLAAGGVLAVIPASTTAQAAPLLFKFAETPLPSSFSRMSFHQYPVYGIARFGETNALSAIQISELASRGRLSSSSSFDPAHAADTNSPLDKGGSGPTPPDQGSCVAGGPGSTSCGAGGCTVTCGAGTYACCQGGTSLCAPSGQP